MGLSGWHSFSYKEPPQLEDIVYLKCELVHLPGGCANTGGIDPGGTGTPSG